MSRPMESDIERVARLTGPILTTEPVSFVAYGGLLKAGQKKTFLKPLRSIDGVDHAGRDRAESERTGMLVMLVEVSPGADAKAVRLAVARKIAELRGL